MSVKIHFLNVGDGDCTIVHLPERKVEKTDRTKNERIMMIDMFHHDDHEDYEDVIEYYKEHFPGKAIFRFVCSHPHKDHFTGIKKLFKDADINIWNFWDLEHAFVPEEFQDDMHEEDWNEYMKIRAKDGYNVTVIQTARENTPKEFWNDDEDRITILSPSQKLIEAAHKKEDGTKRKPHEVDLNNMPYVLLLRINNLKIIFASDAEEKCWEDILENCGDLIKNCDILKAAHHGRLTGFHEKAVKKMNPKYIVFSLGKNTEQEYGAEDDYKDAVPNAKILKTHELGTFIAECDFKGGITFLNL